MDNTTKGNNTLRAKWQISTIRTGRITEDFIEDCKEFLEELRRFVPDFRNLNVEIESHDFRQASEDAEEFFEILMSEYRGEGYFNHEIYADMLERIMFMVEYAHEEDDLADMFNSVNIK